MTTPLNRYLRALLVGVDFDGGSGSFAVSLPGAFESGDQILLPARYLLRKCMPEPSGLLKRRGRIRVLHPNRFQLARTLIFYEDPPVTPVGLDQVFLACKAPTVPRPRQRRAREQRTIRESRIPAG
jgi:hypothetical protein